MKTVRSKAYVNLSPRRVRQLFHVSLGGLWGWFALKFFLTPDRPAVLVAVGVCLLVGVATGIVVFLSDLSFVAHAPEKAIDEYQLARRNRAYLATLRYGAAALAAAWLARMLQFPPHPVTAPVLENFILVLFLTMLIAPAGFLATHLIADETPAGS